MTPENMLSNNAEKTEDLEAGEIVREESIPVSGSERTYIEATNVSYTVKGTQILKNVDACFPPGRLVALMGPSGAGKTTLLNVLAGRGNGKVDGEILVNGQRATRHMMRKMCKVVPQHDILTPVLTARETLMYTAELALRVPKSERKKRVDEVIEMLSLTPCADVVCGGPDLKGLSGGQLKRVSIAMELLSNPTCLLLDEPTSGLDSKVAADVVDLIKALAHGGRTVICTIHQPSFQVFATFDWLVMLERGSVAYNGYVSKVSNFLEEVGHPAPQFVNPADHLLEVLSEAPNTHIDGVTHAEVFKNTSFYEASKSDFDTHVSRRTKYITRLEQGVDAVIVKSRGNSTSALSQFWTISRRALYVTMKDKRQLRTRVMQLVFVGLVIGTIYFRMDRDQDRVQDKLSLMFMILLFLGMSSIMNTAMAVPEEKFIMQREYVNGYYGLGAYYFGRVGVLLLFQVIYAIFFGSALYYMVGLYDPAKNFFVFLSCLVLIAIISGVSGFAAGVVFPTPQAVSAVVPMIILPLTIFSGLFIPLPNIPDYWVWLYYLSFFQYGLQIMMVNEFHDSQLNACSLQDLQTPGACPYGACSANISEPQACPGDVVLTRLDYDPDDLPMNFGILIQTWEKGRVLKFREGLSISFLPFSELEREVSGIPPFRKIVREVVNIHGCIISSTKF